MVSELVPLFIISGPGSGHIQIGSGSNPSDAIWLFASSVIVALVDSRPCPLSIGHLYVIAVSPRLPDLLSSYID